MRSVFSTLLTVLMTSELCAWWGPPGTQPQCCVFNQAHSLDVIRKPETVATLKRTIETLMEKGAIIRNLENLGEKNLPYKISKHSQRHTRGGYFLVDFYSPPNIVPSVLDHLSRDIDVIRPTILKHEEEKPPQRPCPGMLPPTDLESKFRSRKKK